MKRSGSLAAQVLDDFSSQMFIDLTMSRDGFGDLGGEISIPVVIAAMPNQNTAHLFNFAYEIEPFHANSNSALCRMPGMSPLTMSL